MAQQIYMRPEALGGIEQQLWGGIDEYCGFTLDPLSPSLPVGGSGDHDGRLSSLLSSALSAFHQVIANDVSNVRNIGSSLGSADRQAAARWGSR